uniref:molybdopterin biosynthesis protein n=1 Tax=Anunuuluaehu liula TaxID=3049639 RepID=UPI00300273B1
MKEINPYSQIHIYSYKLTKENALDLIKMYDIILDTSDNFKTRYIIDYACQELHKIHIYGAIQNFEGQISVFNYKNGPKYSDIYPNNLNLETNTCNEIGVLGVIPGIIGILQATEAIKIIIGIGEILSGKILIYNAINMSFKKVKIENTNKKKVVNKINQDKLEETNIILEYELKNKIANNENIAIIDVRQNREFKIKHIQNAINVPLTKIKQKKNIELINNTFSNKIIVIYCSNNSRSIIASKILNANKINHYRLKDGLNNFNK